MSQAEDIDAIAAYMAGARGNLRAQLSRGEITSQQAGQGEGIAMDFQTWLRNLGWYDKRASSGAMQKARQFRDAFNAAVTPHAYAFVNATAHDIPEKKRAFAVDKKGNVVHKKSGKVIKPKDTSLPPGSAPAPGAKAEVSPPIEPVPVAPAPVAPAPITPAPVKPAPVGPSPVKPAAKEAKKLSESSMLGLSPVQIGVGLAVVGAVGIGLAVSKPAGKTPAPTAEK